MIGWLHSFPSLHASTEDVECGNARSATGAVTCIWTVLGGSRPTIFGVVDSTAAGEETAHFEHAG